MGKKKIANIFNLYKHETIVEVSDPHGNAIKIKIKKLTSDQSRSASEYLDTRLATEKSRIDAAQREFILKTFQHLPKSRLADLIISIEAPYIRDIIDLAPQGEGDIEKTTKDKWESSRREKLDTETEESLISYLVDLSIESKAKNGAFGDYNRMVLCLSCLDPDTGEQIFSMDEQEPNYIGHCSQDAINFITNKRLEIATAETQGEIRRAAKDPNFT